MVIQAYFESREQVTQPEVELYATVKTRRESLWSCFNVCTDGHGLTMLYAH